MAYNDMLMQNVRGKWTSANGTSAATNPSFENQSTSPTAIVAGAGPKAVAPIGPTQNNRIKLGS